MTTKLAPVEVPYTVASTIRLWMDHTESSRVVRFCPSEYLDSDVAAEEQQSKPRGPLYEESRGEGCMGPILVPVALRNALPAHFRILRGQLLEVNQTPLRPYIR